MDKEKVVGGGTGTPVDLTQRETVYATDKHPFKEKGEEIRVAPALAADLLKRGLATEKKPKE